MSIYQAGRSDLVFIGASVCWGLGNDISTQYTSLIQQKINSTLSTPLAGPWTARMIHTDDWQPATSGTSADVPFNASNEGGTFGWGVGPVGAKFTYDSSLTKPGVTSEGPFSGYMGFHTASGGPDGPWTDPGVLLLGGHNIKITSFTATTYPTYLQLGASASGPGGGQLDIYSSWKPGSGLEGTMSVPGGGTAAKNQLFALSTPPVGFSGPWVISVFADNTGTNGPVLIHQFCPFALQATTGILVNVAARDSYCLADYQVNVGMPGGAVTAASVIQSACVNKSYRPRYVIFDSYNSWVQDNTYDGLWVSTTPYTAGQQVAGSDNKLYTAVVNNTGHNPVGDGGVHWSTINNPADRRLNPTQWAAAIQTLGDQLAGNSVWSGAAGRAVGDGFGDIIVTIPFVPGVGPMSGGCPAGPAGGTTGTAFQSGQGLAMLTNPTTGKAYTGADYLAAINLLSRTPLAIVDQSTIPVLTTANFFHPDCIHPKGYALGSGNGTDLIAQKFISVLGL